MVNLTMKVKYSKALTGEVSNTWWHLELILQIKCPQGECLSPGDY